MLTLIPPEDVEPPPPELPLPGPLDTDQALRLLTQSGLGELPGAPGSAAWLQGMIDALCKLSSRDALTGLANRRAFEVALLREIDRVARSGEPALLLMLDIDHFKRVNDNHGHLMGDQVIRAVAQLINECVRPMDTPARIGGEEFAIILPNCSPAFGLAVAERLRTRIAEHNVKAGQSGSLGVTVSIGGAYAPQWVRSSPVIWAERADLQLYRAKFDGRNRTCLEPTPDSTVSAEEKGMLFGGHPPEDLE